jgi:catechol 2,3-dioxygenase-like lactoylglutathione lyase family enzyme
VSADSEASPSLRGLVPFLRVRDAEAAAEWYARLGFEVEWRHRFEPGLPLFVSVARPELHWRLFLSEHEGDARPDTLVYLYTDDIDPVAAEFGSKVARAPYGVLELELTDPDGNRLRIGQLEG